MSGRHCKLLSAAVICVYPYLSHRVSGSDEHQHDVDDENNSDDNQSTRMPLATLGVRPGMTISQCKPDRTSSKPI